MYRPGFTEGDYEEIKDAAERLGVGHPFCVNDLLLEAIRAGITSSPEDVEAEIKDLCDLGYLERIDGGQVRWERVGRPGSGLTGAE